MRCRKRFRKVLRRPSLLRSANALLAAFLVSGLAGCGMHFGSLDAPERKGTEGANATPQRGSDDETPGLPTKLLAKMLGVKTGDTKGDGNAAPNEKDRHIFCPEVILPEGSAASRAYAGTPPSSANLRYQFALGETARQCALDADQLSLKIGVAGKVLLGPAGGPGSFAVPVRMAILRKNGNETVVAKLYHATVNIGQNETQGDFTVISEPLHVPFIQDHTDQDYTVRVWIDEGPAPAEKPRKATKR